MTVIALNQRSHVGSACAWQGLNFYFLTTESKTLNRNNSSLVILQYFSIKLLASSLKKKKSYLKSLWEILWVLSNLWVSFIYHCHHWLLYKYICFYSLHILRFACYLLRREGLVASLKQTWLAQSQHALKPKRPSASVVVSFDSPCCHLQVCLQPVQVGSVSPSWLELQTFLLTGVMLSLPVCWNRHRHWLGHAENIPVLWSKSVCISGLPGLMN